MLPWNRKHPLHEDDMDIDMACPNMIKQLEIIDKLKFKCNAITKNGWKCNNNYNCPHHKRVIKPLYYYISKDEYEI